MTKTERVLIANQNRILAFLDTNDSENYLLKAEIAEKGYEGLYEKLFESINEEVPKEICDETYEILTMYQVINNLTSSLLPEQKEQVDMKKIRFEGFDLNNDKHYFFMKFIVEKTEQYEEYKDAYLNSNSISSLRKYRQMLTAYKQFLEANQHQLSFAGLQSIIEAI